MAVLSVNTARLCNSLAPLCDLVSAHWSFRYPNIPRHSNAIKFLPHGRMNFHSKKTIRRPDVGCIPHWVDNICGTNPPVHTKDDLACPYRGTNCNSTQVTLQESTGTYTGERNIDVGGAATDNVDERGGTGTFQQPGSCDKEPGVIYSTKHRLIKHFLKLKRSRRYSLATWLYVCWALVGLPSASINASKEFVVLGLENVRRLSELFPSFRHSNASGEEFHGKVTSSLTEYPGHFEGPVKAISLKLLTESATLASSPGRLIRHSTSVHLCSPNVMDVLFERSFPEFSIKNMKRSAERQRTTSSSQRHAHSRTELPGNRTVAIARLLCSRDTLVKPKFLVGVDRVKFPSNLGALLRAAAVLGADSFFFVNGSADPLSWKVIEQSWGMHLQLPLMFGDEEHLIDLCNAFRLVPIVAHTCGRPPEGIRGLLAEANGICLVLGNEASGPSEHLKKKCCPVSVPMSPFVESLNVGSATSIVVSELKLVLDNYVWVGT